MRGKMHIRRPSASRTEILALPAHCSHREALKECLGLRPTFGMAYVKYSWWSTAIDVFASFPESIQSGQRPPLPKPCLCLFFPQVPSRGHRAGPSPAGPRRGLRFSQRRSHGWLPIVQFLQWLPSSWAWEAGIALSSQYSGHETISVGSLSEGICQCCVIVACV